MTHETNPSEGFSWPLCCRLALPLSPLPPRRPNLLKSPRAYLLVDVTANQMLAAQATSTRRSSRPR